jgi:hypothetical protein
MWGETTTETITTTETQEKKPAAAITSATAVSVAKSETAGLLWDASNSRMLSAIGTPATAA